MDRRSFLRSGTALAGLASTAGCLSRLGFESRSVRAPPVVENPPKAVYVPSHVEGMKMAGMADAGPYRCTLAFSFPHRFWLVTGRNRQQVDVRSDDSVHLMVSLWDADTGIVPPTSDVALEIVRDGETVVEKTPWPMLSQNMGFHFGDNVALPGDGTYAVTVGIGPMQTRRTGTFEGAFENAASATVSFDFSRQQLEDVPVRLLDERKGQRGAVDPMTMETMPLAQLPPADRLPGRIVGDGSSGDGTFVATMLDRPPSGIDRSGTYLAVSARTPYHRYPLPFMSLAGTVVRNGDTVLEGPLRPTLDPDLNYHYGRVVPGLRSGDTIELSIGAPPQVARHEGYETAFFDMDPMELSVP